MCRYFCRKSLIINIYSILCCILYTFPLINSTYTYAIYHYNYINECYDCTNTNAGQESDDSTFYRLSQLDRIVAAYDFDEHENPYPIPDRWIRMTALDMPKWNSGQFIPASPSPANPVDRVYQLSTIGGSTGIRLVQGVIAAIPFTDYTLTADIRTIDLQHSRGRIYVQFTDSNGTLIPESRTACDPVITNGDWQTVNIELLGDYPNVAWIEIELLLEQQERWNVQPSYSQDIQLQDVKGSVQFNNLLMTRLPRITLSISDTNIINAPDPIEINIEVQDAGKRALHGNIDIFDINDNLVDHHDLPRIYANESLKWSPAISRYGWYRAVMDASDESTLVGQVQLDFAYLPQNKEINTGTTYLKGHGFSIVADDIEPALWKLAIPMFNQIGAHAVILSLWPEDLTLNNISEYRHKINNKLFELVQTGYDITLAIPLLPDEVTSSLSYQQAGKQAIFDVLKSDNQLAWDFLDPLLINLGQRFRNWQLGPVSDNHTIVRPDLISGLSHIHKKFSHLVPDPTVIIPWSADYEIPAKYDLITPDITTDITNSTISKSSISDNNKPRYGISLWIPNELSPHGAARRIRNALNSDLDITAVFEPASFEKYGRMWSGTDLMKRTILTWEEVSHEINTDILNITGEVLPQNHITLAIPHPWVYQGTRRKYPVPSPLLPVWKTLINHLSNRLAVARAELSPDVIAVIFKEKGNSTSGTIALWNESPEYDYVKCYLSLGNEPVYKTDMFGNTLPINVKNNIHELVIGKEPVFIDGADIQLALFRAGFTIEPKFVDTGQQLHEHFMKLYNPWNSSISGKIVIKEPAGWNFNQHVIAFSIPANSSTSIPIKFVTPNYIVAGVKQFKVEILLTDTPSWEGDNLILTAPVEAGYKQITFTPSYRFVKNKDGTELLIITQEIINNSDEAAWLETFAMAKGYPFKRADISNLAPGGSITRIFRFDLSNNKDMEITQVRVGLREIRGQGRLNQILLIEQPE